MYLLNSIYVFLDMCNSFLGWLWGSYLQRSVFLRSRQEHKKPNQFSKATPNPECCNLRQGKKVEESVAEEWLWDKCGLVSNVSFPITDDKKGQN